MDDKQSSMLQRAVDKHYERKEHQKSLEVIASVHDPDPTTVLIPATEHILIKKEEALNTLKGIHIPGQAAQKTRPFRGTVVAIGEDVTLFQTIEAGLRVGDTLVYHEYGEVTFYFNETEYVAIKASDVICKVSSDGTAL